MVIYIHTPRRITEHLVAPMPTSCMQQNIDSLTDNTCMWELNNKKSETESICIGLIVFFTHLLALLICRLKNTRYETDAQTKGHR
jgi:hypothetical protein